MAPAPVVAAAPLAIVREAADDAPEQAAEAFKPTLERLQEALKVAEAPLSRFMLAQTSKAALNQVAHLAGEPADLAPMQRGFTVKLAAFVLSELKSAFQIGCMLFIPFLIIDLLVSSVLMSMGMMMLPPVVVSLPLKLFIFVLADGWYLVVGSMVRSFQ